MRTTRSERSAPQRVFLSHTSDLADSVVRAAADAVSRAEKTVVDMAYFAAGPRRPMDVCADRINSSDVYVCLAGPSFGTAIPDNPNKSFTEWEFEVATAAAIPRLGFLVGDPADEESDPRQVAFRRRLQDAGITVTRVSSTPKDVELAVYHALVELRAGRPRPIGYHVTAPPAFLVDRPEIDTLAEALVSEDPALVGVYGTGGFGKTTMVSATCHRADVRARFTGGIAWVTLGASVTGRELAAKIDDLCELLSGTRPELSDPEQAGFRLGELLAGFPDLLLVVDDVWQPDQLRVFLAGDGPGKRLITTRDRRLLGSDAIALRAGELSDGSARELLLRDVDGIPPDVARSLVRECGGFPLLLPMVNSCIRRFVQNGEPVETAALRVLELLVRHGPQGLDRRTDIGQARVRATLEASLGLLDDADRERYHRLAVFAEDEPITPVELDLVWGSPVWPGTPLDPFEIETYRDELVDLSVLVQEPGRSEVRLHDVLRSYLRSILDAADLATSNRLLVTAAAERIGAAPGETVGPPWWRLPGEHGYLWRHLALHLREGRLPDEYERLVTDPRWIAEKARRFGAVAVDVDLTSPSDTVGRVRAEVARHSHLLSALEPDGALLSTVVSRIGLGAGDPDGVAAELDTTAHLTPTWELPDLPAPGLRRILRGHGDAVWGLAVAPDGAWLISGSTDGTARIWDVADGTVRHILTGHTGRVNCCAVAPDGTWAATAGDDTTVRVWDTGTGECRQVLTEHTDWVWSCAVSGDGRYLVSVGDDGVVLVWSCAGWHRVRTLRGHTAGVNACAVDRTGALVATGADDRCVRIWDATDGRTLAVLRGHDDWVRSCALARDGSVLVTAGSADLSVRVWDTASWRQRTIYLEHTASVNVCAVTPDGRRVVSTGSEGAVHVWDSATGETLDVLAGHAAGVRACALAPDATWLATGGDDGTVRLWTLAATPTDATLRTPGSPVWSCTTTTGGRVVSGADDGRIRMFDATTRAPAGELTNHTGPVRGVTTAPDGRRIAATADDGSVTVWDSGSGESLAQWNAHQEWASACRFLPTGDVLVTCGGDEALKFWDPTCGRLLRVLDRHPTWLWDCDVGPDGRHVAVAGQDGRGYVHDVHDVTDASSASDPVVLAGPPVPLRACAFTPDGRQLLTGGDDGVLRVWDVATGAEIRARPGHDATIWSICTTPAHPVVATAGADSTIRIWSTGPTDPLTAIRVDGPLRCVRWDDDGRTLTAGGAGGLYRFTVRGGRFSPEPTPTGPVGRADGPGPASGNDVVVARRYGMTVPDQFGGTYLGGPDLLVFFTGDLDRHRRELASRVENGDRLQVRPCRQTWDSLCLSMLQTKDLIGGRPELGIREITIGMRGGALVVRVQLRNVTPGTVRTLRETLGPTEISIDPVGYHAPY